MSVHPLLARVARAVYEAELDSSLRLGADAPTALLSAWVAYDDVYRIAMATVPTHYQTTEATTITGRGKPW